MVDTVARVALRKFEASRAARLEFGKYSVSDWENHAIREAFRTLAWLIVDQGERLDILTAHLEAVEARVNRINVG